MQDLIDLLDENAVGEDGRDWNLEVWPDLLSLKAATKDTYKDPNAAFEAANALLNDVIALGHTLCYLSRIGVYTHTRPQDGAVEWRGTIDVRLDARD